MEKNEGMEKSDFELFRKYLLTFFRKKVRLLFLGETTNNTVILNNSRSILMNMNIIQNKSHEIFIEKCCPVLDFDGLEKKEIADKVYSEIAMLNIPSVLIFSGGGYHVYHLSEAFVICPESDSFYNSSWIRLPYSWNMEKENYAKILKLTEMPEWKDKGNHNSNSLIFKLLQKIIIDKDPPHYARLFLVIFLSLKGYSESSILNYIRSLGWIDFDERKTRYQINYIMNWHGGFKFLPTSKFLERYGLIKYLETEECLY